jgi:hypothetical protein
MSNDEELVWEHLREIFLLASEQALLDTVEAIASKVGVSEIDGFPVREFFDRRKREIGERLVADFADTNPRMASDVKAALDQMDREVQVNREREDQPNA